jgi:Na+/proline symporter
MVRARWGTGAHITFLCFGFMANIIVTSMLLLGGAATVNALTGMNIDLASFLIPWGVILYTAAGGLEATFLASYLHTAIIFLVLVICVYTVYVKEFSTDLVYQGLQNTISYSQQQCEAIFSDSTGKTFFKAGDYACGPVPDNKEGSYLTMMSLGGLKFGIINIVGNFGTVFVDQSYWQSAIAAKPASAHKGYLLGGFVWFTIPFALATSLGLCALALQLPISSSEAGAGLVPPAVATHLFGKSGSVMMAIMLFMAITSTGSAEGIAVSSLVAYDIYKTYVNPKATGNQVLMVSRVVVVVFGLIMGVLSVLLNRMGLNLGWVYMFMGNAIGSAVVPLWNLLMWKDANAAGAICGAWGGMIMALLTWLIYAQAQSEEITVDSLGQLEPNLAGNLVAICSSGIIHAVFSLVKPQNYDFKSMGEIEMLEDDTRGLDEADFTDEFLTEAKRWVQKWGWTFTIIMVVVWPILSLPAEVFSKSYFAMWVFISLAWSFVATIVIIALPIVESWDSIMGVTLALLGMRKEDGQPDKKQPEGVAVAPYDQKQMAGESPREPLSPRSPRASAEPTAIVTPQEPSNQLQSV